MQMLGNSEVKQNLFFIFFACPVQKLIHAWTSNQLQRSLSGCLFRNAF